MSIKPGIYTMEEARKLGLIPPENQELADPDESSKGTEAKLGTARRVRVIRPIAPEKNDDFTGMSEACKKLRNVEKARTGLGNLAKEKKGRPAVLDPLKLAILLEPYGMLEAELDAELADAYYREVPRAIQEWWASVPGLGKSGSVNNLARVLGDLGHPVHARPYKLKDGELLAEPEFHRSLRQLWAYAGNGDVTRQPGRNFTGEMSQSALLAGGKQWLRTRTHVIAQSCVKLTGEPDKNGRARARSPYRDVYEEEKAIAVTRGWGEEKRRVPFPSNRADMHAYRITRKEILRDLYEVSKGTCC